MVRFEDLKILLFSLCLSSHFFAQKIEGIPNGKEFNFQNLHRINDSMYRSEQPSKTGIKELQQLGIKSVLSVRNNKSDRFLKHSCTIPLYHKRINAWTMTEDELIAALKLLVAAEKPVLIHCVHGSDRTGTVVAAYRIVFEGWTKEKAIEEMTSSGYGFHENFQNLLVLLRELDVERVKKELGLL